MAEKYRSQIREKVKARKKRTEGRSLAYNPVEKRDPIKAPKGAKKELLQSFRERAKQSAVARVKEVISKKAKAVGKGLGKGLSEGLGDIRHPAQLIPAFRAGNFFADMIQKRTKK